MLIRTATEFDWPSIWPFWICTIDESDESDEYGSPAPAEDAGHIDATYHLGPNHGGAGSHVANASYLVAS
ncbi:MAG: hypothetical protein JWN47_1931 [Frankiales bacterium]|jgi:hypothetical protein|nr:hypothetical protein [Frankiales bacterium]